MDAIELLTLDHREVEDLFDRLSTADDDERKEELLGALAQALATHAAVEQAHFYPLFEEAELAELVERLGAEHDAVKEQLAALAEIDPSDEEFDAKVEELHRSVEAHVAEEERHFSRVRELVNAEQLRELAGQLRAARASVAESELLKWAP